MNEEELIRGGQGRTAEDIWFSAWCVMACCGGIMVALMILGASGCSSRLPNEHAAKNNLRKAIADPNYKAPPTSEEGGSQPYNRAQQMVEQQYPR